MATAKTTTLDNDVTKPSKTVPGDGPADTTNPLERASTVTPQPSAETVASGAGTVNGQLPLPNIEEAPKIPADEHRYEEYDAVTPEGKVVRVQHNLDTGATRVKAATSTDTGSTATQSSR
jgi:hypothetical protein